MPDPQSSAPKPAEAPKVELYHITMPVSVDKETETRVFHSSLPTLARIKKDYRTDKMIHTGDQFHASREVKDQVAASLGDDDLKIFERKSWPPIHPGGTVLLLESPHKDEYDGKFVPRAPLWGKRHKFRDYFPSVVSELARHGISLPKGDVILCNPVPFQASLHRILNPDDQGKKPLVGSIRDLFWSEIFQIGLVRNHFINRLISYAPQLILNCCTQSLKGYVHGAIEDLVKRGALSCSVVEFDHPSGWHNPHKVHGNSYYLTSMRVVDLKMVTVARAPGVQSCISVS